MTPATPLSFSHMIAIAPPSLASLLTERELSVCVLIAHGEMRQRIANDLHIGTETVDTHMEKAATKLADAFPWLERGTPRQIILRYSASTAAFSRIGEQAGANDGSFSAHLKVGMAVGLSGP